MPVMMVLVLALAACQPASTTTQAVPVTGSTPTVAAAMPTTAPTTAAATATTASSAASAAANAPSLVSLTTKTDAKLGSYLADDKGMTLYIYTKDSPGTSVCEGKCLAAWPALYVAKGGKAQIDGKDDTNLSTITRSDGSMQIAYKGMPLYYFVKDKQPGDVTGQGVGGVWYVVNPGNASNSGSGAAATATPSSSGSSSSSGGSAMAAPSQVSLTVRTDPKLGKFLADDKGMTLYIYTKDSPGKSVCEGQCLANWPALMVAKGGSSMVQGMDASSKLGTVTRSDGSTQVAWNGMPLYYFVKDKQPGDVTGQGVGGVWFVVNPDSASGTSSSSSSSAMAAPSQVSLTVRTDAKLGKYLADDKGMTLYIYTKDTPGVSNCEGKCLAAWPALMVAKGGKVEVQGMDEGSKLSTITRSDGSTQIAFNGMPLYYWVKDQKAGDTTGQGVGGVWFVVAP